MSAIDVVQLGFAINFLPRAAAMLISGTCWDQISAKQCHGSAPQRTEIKAMMSRVLSAGV